MKACFLCHFSRHLCWGEAINERKREREGGEWEKGKGKTVCGGEQRHMEIEGRDRDQKEVGEREEERK